MSPIALGEGIVAANENTFQYILGLHILSTGNTPVIDQPVIFRRRLLITGLPHYLNASERKRIGFDPLQIQLIDPEQL